MKRVFICAIALSLFVTINRVHAQKGFSVSVKGGSQLNYLRNADDNDNSHYSNKTFIGGNFGIGAGYNFTDNLGVAVDFSYSIQGRRFEIDGNEYREKMNYVKIPVMFSYNTNPDKKISFVGKIGPQVSLLTNSRLADDDGHSIFDDTNARYNSATFGAVANVGIQCRMSKNLYLTSGIRVDHDFTNAEDDQAIGYQSGRATSYNSTVSLQSGLKYVIR